MLENKQSPKTEISIFAETNFRNRYKKFGIKTDDRRRHMYIIGKTGMAKSTLMKTLIISDIMSGRGVALVDPHGDFAEELLDYIPPHRINDVVYFNPGDIENPIAFNILEVFNPDSKHLVASGLVDIFKKQWADSWGPRLEYVLRNAILALMDYPDSTMLGIMRILSDKVYRKKVIAKIKDPLVKSFWADEYSKYPDKFQAEAIAPIQNKVGQFLSTELIRNIVGQVRSSIDLRDVMDKQKILILNLSKGRIGEHASGLLGAMMITKIQLAAMERVDIPEEKRKDFYLYVDEFQNFSTESFANILSEARKYRLNIIMAHQYIEQLSEEVRGAVFGNVGTIIAFRVGATDAEVLAKEFAPEITEEDLVGLSKYEFYLKLMIDGVSSSPFSAKTFLIPKPNFVSNKAKIIKTSNERYASKRSVIMDKIVRWSGMNMDEDEEDDNDKKINQSDKSYKKDAPSVPEHDVNCDNCGKTTTINFIPDGIRKVFCKDCLKEARSLKTQELKRGLPASNNYESSVIGLSEAMAKEPILFSGRKNKTKVDTEKSDGTELKPDKIIKF